MAAYLGLCCSCLESLWQGDEKRNSAAPRSAVVEDDDEEVRVGLKSAHAQQEVQRFELKTQHEDKDDKADGNDDDDYYTNDDGDETGNGKSRHRRRSNSKSSSSGDSDDSDGVSGDDDGDDDENGHDKFYERENNKGKLLEHEVANKREDNGARIEQQHEIHEETQFTTSATPRVTADKENDDDDEAWSDDDGDDWDDEPENPPAQPVQMELVNLPPELQQLQEKMKAQRPPAKQHKQESQDDGFGNFAEEDIEKEVVQDDKEERDAALAMFEELGMGSQPPPRSTSSVASQNSNGRFSFSANVAPPQQTSGLVSSALDMGEAGPGWGEDDDDDDDLNMEDDMDLQGADLLGKTDLDQLIDDDDKLEQFLDDVDDSDVDAA
ncbi:Hypothetical Protein FCC1311_085132 [Hondaea fermentalgiana]|uniref:Uncharacterized protein n=1 Tax=Hondaea fermentalgiana TaxID=2315210 RepID=A0A2R5GR99_9STRA|nr:Hypothetical Protein FCC1311_085132 [Hondaea fermentalgiana]|eukprot:GBG32288.1 Hypothetical Protein FCC1311_085132 [Hondaea fermentalgiana]